MNRKFAMRIGALLLLGLLAAYAVSRGLSSHPRVEKHAVATFDLRMLGGAVDAYLAREGVAPQSQEDLVAAGLLGKVRRDPWTGAPYRSRIRHGTLEFYALGFDDHPGGRGDNEDIYSKSGS